MNDQMQDGGALDTRNLGLVPMVIETTGRGERAYDIYSRMLRNVWFSWSGRLRTICPT